MNPEPQPTVVGQFQGPEAQLSVSASSAEKATHKINRKTFALRSLIFIGSIFGLLVLLRLLEPAFARGMLLRPFHIALVACALVAFILFIWNAMLPRMRDIGLSGSSLWVVLVLVLVLPVTAAACLVLATVPSGSLPSEPRRRSAETEDDSSPHFKKRFTRFWHQYFWVLPFLLISPAVFLIPADVFTQYPWAKTYTDWLAQWVPMIDRAAHLHPHPDKFRAFFAYAWSWLPLLLVLVWFASFERMNEHAKEALASQAFTTLLAVALFLWGLWLAVCAPGQLFGGVGLIERGDMRVRLYYSDWALLWSGPMHVLAASSFILVLVCIANASGPRCTQSRPPARKTEHDHALQ